jgi:hypothetical protein
VKVVGEMLKPRLKVVGGREDAGSLSTIDF